MQVVKTLASWSDEKGNRIEVPPGAEFHGTFEVIFRGSNNVLKVGRRPRLGLLKAVFDCSDGTLVIGPGDGALSLNVRVGQDSRIRVGRDTTSTDVVGMSATEGTKIVVGKDVMFASGVQVRADDGHPIFDVRTGRRVNVSKDIGIGEHVWIGWGCTVLGGSTIGNGSVLGIGSVLKGRVPNNAIAVGVPAKTKRRDIAWERPHLSLIEPFYKPDASTLTRTEAYWNLTEEPVPTPDPEPAPALRGTALARRLGGRLARRLGLRH